MAAKKYVVHLSETQRQHLEGVVRSQKASTLIARRARVLLLSDANHCEGRRPDWQIGEIVGLTEKQVKRIRQTFARQGFEATLKRRSRSDAGIPQKMDGRVEAKLVAICCSEPPEGHQRWTLQLLVDELCRLKIVANVCRETVRKTLKKIASNHGKQNAFVFPKKTVPASLRTWNESSTLTTKNTTKSIR